MDFALWELDDGTILGLIKPGELDVIPNGTVLCSIDGERVVVGEDEIDKDTRYGFLAYGRILHEGGK